MDFLNIFYRLVNPYLIEIEANKLNSSEPKHTGETVSTTNLNEEFEYVDTLKALNKLKNELSCRDRIKEIAVDLEHHNMRSYQGYTCLLQISTRYKDYVIDAIKLRSNINILNEIFTDSTLLKVFHSPFCDVKWLQKDFGIYLVNIFDTSAAGFLLKKRQFALKEFIELYFNVKINKNYTMADWSVRPLKMGMIDYARNDTHYLLSIYDNLRSELVNKTLFKVCQDNSNEICKKVYVKPTFDLKASRHRLKNKSYSKSISLSHRQIKAIDLLSEWRDNLARELDESCEYVLKNEVLFKIGKVMPKNRKELFELLVNLYDESIVQIRENEILQLVLRARNF